MLSINDNIDILCLDGEVWRDVVGWEELYEVSNLGRVRTKYRVIMYDRNKGKNVLEPKTITQRIRKQKLNKHTGYLMVGLNGKGKSINVTVHSMVAHAFIEYYVPQGSGKGMCTNHKDGCKTNNNVDNLEVISLGDNTRHMFETGLSTTNHRVMYEGVVYNSKTKLRKCLNMSEYRMNKLIVSGGITQI